MKITKILKLKKEFKLTPEATSIPDENFISKIREIYKEYEKINKGSFSFLWITDTVIKGNEAKGRAVFSKNIGIGYFKAKYKMDFGKNKVTVTLKTKIP